MADTCVCGHPRDSHIFEPYTFISPCDECDCEQFREPPSDDDTGDTLGEQRANDGGA